MSPAAQAGRAAPPIPRATYRLQFTREFGLRDAKALVPYLHDLGISHIYASPILKAVPGSSHGYDVCDFDQVNPELGTEADLMALVDLLHERGMGLVLDVVSNHMAIGGHENPLWWDVLTHGQASRYAYYFDIDWEPPDPRLRGKVLVPVLADRYENVLRRGEFRLAQETDTFTLRYLDHVFPLAPPSLDAITKPLKELNADPVALDCLIQLQNYRLALARHADAEVNYRRFFTITSLAGLRMEDERVFDRVHALLRRWLDAGMVDGLRVDHPDGLRDPQQYLERLNDLAPAAWRVVEKILTPGESLSPSWPVAGTTGYDFLHRMDALLINPAGEKPLTDFYAAFTGEPADFTAIMSEKKSAVVRESFAAEINRLLGILRRVAAGDCHGCDFTGDQLKEALGELVACFPVYRTYAQAESGRLSPADASRIQKAADLAMQRRPALASLFRGLRALLLLQRRGEAENDFVMRFQQLTGPAMAKGVEDTAFYCFNRLVSLNEVGGAPDRFGISLESFHQACREAEKGWPTSMLATSTHDTKRSEDVRARLALLSEIPTPWVKAVRRWSAMNEKHRSHDWPDRNAEYLFYQTLVGAWPISLERLLAFMDKAACEAKQHTAWTERNPVYHEALRNFVKGAMNEAPFLADLNQFVAALRDAGYVNSLAQTLIKLTAPGVPDIYQGTELWSLRLVDPDNRQPVNFHLRSRLLAESKTLSAADVWQRRGEGLPKLWLIQRGLGLRARRPDLFAASSGYEPVPVSGGKADHIVAFIRGGGVIAVVPRLLLGLSPFPETLPGKMSRTRNFRGADWGDTRLALPRGHWTNELTGERLREGLVPVAGVLRQFPVALLTRKEDN